MSDTYRYVRYPDLPGRVKDIPPESGESFSPGDEVYVKLRSNKDTGRAVVLERLNTNSNDQYNGRILVKYHHDGSTAHVRYALLHKSTFFQEIYRPGKMVRVQPWQKTMVIVSETENYRQLARTQVDAEDFIIEIGSSYGICTNMISQRCKNVIGIDISEDLIQHSIKTYPHIRFECFDAMCDIDHLKEISHGCNKVFIDLGGDRGIDVLLLLLPIIQNELSPNIIIIKNRHMKMHIDTNIDLFNDNNNQWWAMLTEDVAKSKRYDPNIRDKYPLRYPMRSTPDGALICRYHNYDTCLKGAEMCPYNHTICHYCLNPGHRAQTCEEFLANSTES